MYLKNLLEEYNEKTDRILILKDCILTNNSDKETVRCISQDNNVYDISITRNTHSDGGVFNTAEISWSGYKEESAIILGMKVPPNSSTTEVHVEITRSTPDSCERTNKQVDIQLTAKDSSEFQNTNSRLRRLLDILDSSMVSKDAKDIYKYLFKSELFYVVNNYIK